MRVRRFFSSTTVALFTAVLSAAAANAAPPSQAALQAQVDAATPAAKAQVTQAASHGQAAVAALVTRLTQMAPAANGGTTPQAYALGQALERFASQDPPSSTQTTVLPSAAAADPCWYVGSHIWNSYRYYDAGVKVAFAAENHPYWCGNGYSITSNGLTFYENHWVQFPYCLDVWGQAQGWDAPGYSWAHGKVDSAQGLTTPWDTCGTYQSGTAALRINGGGGWDGYNDWG